METTPHENDVELWAMLQSVAGTLAPSFRDVSAPEDVLGDLALLAHERWPREWNGPAMAGDTRVPLSTFLRDRMRDHLREERRRRVRRAALLHRASVSDALVGEGSNPAAPAMLASPMPAPDAALVAEE